MTDTKDWCISRQLWWGHRIPAYFLPEGGYVVAETPEEALKLAREKTGNQSMQMADLRPGKQGNQLLLSHIRPRYRPRHHFLLGCPHDYRRI